MEFKKAKELIQNVQILVNYVYKQEGESFAQFVAKGGDSEKHINWTAVKTDQLLNEIYPTSYWMFSDDLASKYRNNSFDAFIESIRNYDRFSLMQFREGINNLEEFAEKASCGHEIVQINHRTYIALLKLQNQ